MVVMRDRVMLRKGTLVPGPDAPPQSELGGLFDDQARGDLVVLLKNGSIGKNSRRIRETSQSSL